MSLISRTQTKEVSLHPAIFLTGYEPAAQVISPCLCSLSLYSIHSIMNSAAAHTLCWIPSDNCSAPSTGAGDCVGRMKRRLARLKISEDSLTTCLDERLRMIGNRNLSFKSSLSSRRIRLEAVVRFGVCFRLISFESALVDISLLLSPEVWPWTLKH